MSNTSTVLHLSVADGLSVSVMIVSEFVIQLLWNPFGADVDGCAVAARRDTFNQVHLSRAPKILLTRSIAPQIAIQSHLRSKKVAARNIIVEI